LNYVNRTNGVNEGDLIYDMNTMPDFFIEDIERIYIEISA